VRFTQPINQSEIDRLQTWQEGHDYQDGGTYDAKITDTFGNVHKRFQCPDALDSPPPWEARTDRR